MSFVCNDCKKMFARKANLDYHRKNDACKDMPYKCKLCAKGFTVKTSMYRHLRLSCKVKQEEDREKNEIYERLLKLEQENKQIKQELGDENEKLKKEVADIKNQVNQNKDQAVHNKDQTVHNKDQAVHNKDQTVHNKNQMTINKDINNGNINNGNIVNGNVNIILVGHGNEDISKIDKNDIIRALQNGFNSTIKLTETLHFNPKHPEYQNVYISNIKNKYAMMYDGKEWKLIIKEDLINKIYDDKKNYIEENLDEFVNSLSQSRKNALARWLDMDDADDRIAKIKEDIKLLLYNKRNMIEETKTKTLTLTNDSVKINENDVMYVSFLSECTKISNTHTRTSVLYDTFKTWFLKKKYTIATPSNRQFTINLRKHKTVEKIRDATTNVNGIKNLKIIDEYL